MQVMLDWACFQGNSVSLENQALLFLSNSHLKNPIELQESQ